MSLPPEIQAAILTLLCLASGFLFRFLYARETRIRDALTLRADRIETSLAGLDKEYAVTEERISGEFRQMKQSLESMGRTLEQIQKVQGEEKNRLIGQRKEREEKIDLLTEKIDGLLDLDSSKSGRKSD
jgi:hypothetical protein